MELVTQMWKAKLHSFEQLRKDFFKHTHTHTHTHTHKSTNHKENTDIVNYIKIKNLCSSKTFSKQNEKTSYLLKNKYGKNITNKVVVSRKYKNAYIWIRNRYLKRMDI